MVLSVPKISIWACVFVTYILFINNFKPYGLHIFNENRKKNSQI